MIIKDSMVLIHLAKITLLEKSCDYFREVIIPIEIHKEILRGSYKGYMDAKIIEELIEIKKIKIKPVTKEELLQKAREFNIFGGEAEAVALYWQEKAYYLATDDDNIRKKAIILNLNLIGTPSIIINLFKENKINKEKYLQSINELRKIGWFNSEVIDKMKMEVK